MFYPRANNGATVIYTALKPILQTVKGRIDELMNEGKKKLWLDINIIEVYIINDKKYDFIILILMILIIWIN